MAVWQCTFHTVEGTKCFQVKAKDKITAIKKGFKKLEKMGLSSISWEVKLLYFTM